MTQNDKSRKASVLTLTDEKRLELEQRLKYVLTITGDAANKVLDIVDELMPLADQLDKESGARISSKLNDLAVTQEFHDLCSQTLLGALATLRNLGSGESLEANDEPLSDEEHGMLKGCGPDFRALKSETTSQDDIDKLINQYR